MTLPTTTLLHGDCLDVMPTLPANSVSLSVHGDHQEAVNAAHEWCVYDHLCVHHTYLKEVELGPKVHHVATGRTHEASVEAADVAPEASDPNAPPAKP